MAQVHLVLVLSSQDALDRLKAPDCDFEPVDDHDEVCTMPQAKHLQDPEGLLL